MANRKKSMYVWVAITIGLFLLMFFITQFSQLSKDSMIEKMVEDCNKNVPFSESFQKEINELGLNTQPIEKVSEQYCQCTLVEPFSSMNDEQMKQFIGSNTQERLELLGGQENINNRHFDCLKSIKANQS